MANVNSWVGRTNASAISNVVSDRLLKGNVISRLLLVNKSEGDVTVNLRINSSGVQIVQVAPLDLVLKQGEVYVDGGMAIEDRSIIELDTTNQVDYYFVFVKTYPDGNDSSLTPLLSNYSFGNIGIIKNSTV